MDPIWEEEIASIEKRYAGINHVDLLFIGSSSIVYWTSLPDDFKAYSVINAGFGGSKIQDAIDYFDRIVKVFDPLQLILFSGTNDLNGEADSAPPDYVVDRVEAFMTLTHDKLPHTNVFYLSITPTPCRFNVLNDVLKTNRHIKQLAKKKNFTYIDVQAHFLDHGMPKPELFVEDGLHMNALGYEKWISVIRPILDHAMMNRCL